MRVTHRQVWVGAMSLFASNASADVHGVDMDKGSIGSMKELGVTESYKLKRQVVLSASEAAEMIIRYVINHS
jgi:chaperonin GroEL (HSP60 family)